MKIQQFTNEVQEFWYNLISSDIVKDVIDIGTTVVDWVGNIVDALGDLGPVITAAIGGLSLNKLLTNFSKDSEKTAIIDDIIDGIKGTFTKENIEKGLDSIANASSLKEIGSGLLGKIFGSGDSSSDNPLSNAIQSMLNEIPDMDMDTFEGVKSLIANEFSDGDIVSFIEPFIESEEDLSRIIELATASVDADTAAKLANRAATEGGAAANELFAKGLAAVKAMLPELLAVAAAITAVVAVVKILDEAIVTAAEANEKFENSKEAYENTKGELESLNSELDETKSKIEELNSLDKLTVVEKDELKTLEAQRKELETQIELKEKLAEKQQKQTAEDAYNAINHSQTATDITNDGVSTYTVYGSRIEKTSADISRYQDLLKKKSESEKALTELESVNYNGLNLIEKADYKLKKNDLSNSLDNAKDSANELFNSLDTDINDLKEQRDALFDDNGELIDESYRTTADAIERLIIQFTNTGEASDLELKLFDTFHPEQISDKISEIDDSLEITQDNLGATEEEFEKLAEKGVLSVDYIKDNFPNLVTAAEAAGLPLADLVEHFEAMNRAAIEATESGSKGLYSIKDIVDDTNSAFNKAVAAQETDNMGATYDTMYEQYKSAKELLEKGDIGTDDFKATAAMFSPTGAEDAENFKENMSKITRYFTEDNTGISNFLDDLEEKGYADFSDETNSWTLSINDLEKAANDLGIGFEPFMAILGELSDKGFTNDFFATEEDGIAHLAELYGNLADAQIDLQKLEQEDPGNSTAIEAKKKEIEEYENRIKQTEKSLDSLINKNVVDYEEEDAAARAGLQKTIDYYNENKDGLSKEVKNRIIKDLQETGQEYGYTNIGIVSGELVIDTTECEEELSNDPVEVPGNLSYVGPAEGDEIIRNIMDKKVEELEESKENLLNEYQKIDDFGLSEYAEEIKNGTIQSVFGNVDMDKRVIVKWSDRLKEKYKEELASWDYDPEVGSVDTVFGGSERYGEDLDGEGWEVAFTPLLPDGTLLSKDTVDEYFESILKEAYKDGSVTDSELQELDAKGMKIGETYVQGIYAGMDKSLDYDDNGNMADVIGRLMHFSGEDGAVQIAQKEFEGLGGSLDELNEKTTTVKNSFSNLLNILFGGGNGNDKIPNIAANINGDISTNVDSSSVDETNKKLEEAETGLTGVSKPNWYINLSNKYITPALNQIKEIGRQLGLLPKTKTINIKVSSNAVKEGEKVTNGTLTKANGTVNGFANGTISAHANGTKIAIQKDETALVNELGNEGIVRSGRLYEIPGGAQKIHLKRGDVIFNHKQMAELKKNGYVTSNGGRGKLVGAYANGTAIGMMNAYKDSVTGTSTGPSAKSDSSTTKKKTTNNNDDNNNDKTTSSSKELIDWIERKLDVLKTKAERWASIIEKATNSSTISKYYDKLTANYKKTVKTTFDAVTRYNSKAKSVKLDSKYKKLVRGEDSSLFNKNGNLKSYKTLLAKYGEETATAIQEYEEWYDKYQSAIDSYIEACENLYNAPIEEAATKIEKLSESIDLLDSKTDNAIGSKNKNKLIDKKVATQSEALKESYIAKKETASNFTTAKKKLNTDKKLKKYSDLSKSERKKVLSSVNNNEEIDLTYFTEGSAGYKYALAYNTTLKSKVDAAADYNEQLQETIALEREAAKEKFDNVADDYGKKIELLEHGTTYLDNRIAELEASGQTAHIGYYKEQINIENQKKTQYESEYASLKKQLALIPEGTDEWYEAYAELQNVSSEISNCTQETYKLNTAINEAQFNLFDKTTEQLSRLKDENEFLREMMSHEKSFDEETGEFTEAGLAKLNTLTSDYYVSKENSTLAKSKLNELLAMQKSGTLVANGYSFNSMDELNDAVDSYYDKVRDSLKEEYAAQEAIYDLMEESYTSQLNAMKDLIDDKIEALNLEKDLYDYTNQIADKTKNISTLEKQLAAYQGDTSEEGRAKAQQLQVELNEAKKELEETEYERYLSDQEDMLNDLYEEYEELLNKKLEDFMAIVKDGVEKAEVNATTSNNYLSDLKSGLGYKSENSSLASSNSSIESTIKTECAKIEAAVKASSGTSGATPSDAGTNGVTNPDGAVSNTPGTTIADTNQTDQDNKKNVDLLFAAKNYINSNATKAKKDNKLDYSYVNQKIYDFTGGKVLTTAKLKALAKDLGVTYNNAKKTGNLAKKLKKIGFDGFSTGGQVISVDNINRMVKANGDDGIASVRNGEAILTPVQSEQFKELASKLSMLNNMVDYSSAMFDLQGRTGDLSKISNLNQSSSVGDVHLHASFPNITDASKAEDMIRAIQDSQKLQKALQSVTIDRINGSGRLSSRQIR